MFYIKRNTNEFGPYDDKQIKHAYASGKILKRDLIRHQKTDKYISVDQFFKLNKINLNQTEESTIEVITNIIKLQSVFLNPFKYLKQGSGENSILYIILSIILIPVLALAFSSVPLISYTIYGLYFASIWGLILYKFIATKQTDLKTAMLICLATAVTTFFVINIFHSTSIWKEQIAPNLHSKNLISSFICMFFGVAIIEELLKQIYVYFFIVQNKSVTYPRSAIFYGMVAGLAFGIYEGVEYQMTFNKTLDANNNYFYNIIRLTSLPFFHAIWAGIGGYFVSLSFIQLKYKYSFRITGLLLPAILHTFYNLIGLNIFGISCIIISSILLTVYLTRSDLVGKELNNM